MNTFDKNIKKKLYNAEVKVSDGMWASIESQIPVKKERPKVWLLFLLMSFSIPYLIVLNSVSKSQIQSVEVENSKVAKSIADDKIEQYQKGSDDNKNNAAIASSPGSTIESYTTRTLTAQTKLDLTVSQAVTDYKVGTNTDISSNRLYTREYSYNSSQVDNNQINQNLPTEPLSPIDYLSSRTNSELVVETMPSKKLTFLNNPFTKNKKATNQGSFKLIEKSRIYKRSTAVNKATAIAKRYYKAGLCYDEARRCEIFGSRLELEKASVALCPSFERKASGFYVFGDVSTGYSFQNLNPKYADFSNYAAQRNRDEKGAISLSANIGIGKKWANGIILETGLNYDRINTNASKYIDEQSMTMVITYDTIMTSTGTMTSIDTSFLNHTSGKSNLNKFSQFNFPVSLGYEIPVSNRFSLVGKTGVLFNISSSNSGTLVNAGGDSFIYNSEQTQANYFKTNLGLSFTGSLVLQGEITPLLAAYGGINVNYYPNSFSLASNPIDQTYTKLGLNTGLLYRL